MSLFKRLYDSATGKEKWTLDAPVGTWIQETLIGTVNNSNTTFTVSQIPLSAGSFLLTLDGLKVPPAAYTLTLATKTVVFVTPPAPGQLPEAEYQY